VPLLYRRLVVKRRPASLTDGEWLALLSSRFVTRDHFRPRDGVCGQRVPVPTVLCPWCRSRHEPEEVDKCMALPRKDALAADSLSSTSRPLDAGPLEPYSELWDFVTQTSFPDGTKRLPGKLSLSFESGLLGLLLTDLETGSYAFLTSRGLSDLLAEAELRMSDGSLTWRVSKYPARGKSR
jgi:hypothetical protein